MAMGSSRDQLTEATSLSLIRLVRPVQRPVDDEDAAKADGLQSLGHETVRDGEEARHVDGVGPPVVAARRGAKQV